MGGKVSGRVLGTMLGILLAAGLDVAFMPHGFAVVALIAVLLWAAFSVLLANNALFTVFLSAMIIFLLSFVDVPPRVAMTGRLLDTVIGAALALVALCWPFSSSVVARLGRRASPPRPAPLQNRT